MPDLPGLWIITATGRRHEFYFRDEAARTHFVEDLPAMCVFRWREVVLTGGPPQPAGITMDRICGLCGAPGIPRGVEWPWWYEGKPVHPTCLTLREQDADEERQAAYEYRTGDDS